MHLKKAVIQTPKAKEQIPLQLGTQTFRVVVRSYDNRNETWLLHQGFVRQQKGHRQLACPGKYIHSYVFSKVRRVLRPYIGHLERNQLVKPRSSVRLKYVCMVTHRTSYLWKHTYHVVMVIVPPEVIKDLIADEQVRRISDVSRMGSDANSVGTRAERILCSLFGRGLKSDSTLKQVA